MRIGGPKLTLDTTEQLLKPGETTWAVLWTALDSNNLVRLSRIEPGQSPNGTSKLKLTGMQASWWTPVP